ncbi:MAG: Gfo/Idh/MocA family oxidoreductase [Candidatus Nealsonbacteria bacterium]|nr:Gfo/Idh/MocA family oxidoreductase [Candidatus Nealsonbacteria bacterium]
MQTGAPNGKLQHACIGVSGMGWHDFNQIASSPNVEIVALCDVDLTRIGRAAERFPNARRYQDWRELFDKEQKTIDSVNVSIPDHMHAPVTVTALRLGKHVYCQKPLTHEVYEARQVAREAKKTGVVTQMGTQHVSQLADRLGVRMIQDLAVGKIKRVYLWSNKPIGTLRPPGPRPVKTDPVPDGLDWDKWLGTAPVRPYVAGVYHPGLWRGWQDFGVGWLGDMGCHIFDSVYRSLKLTAPKSVRARVEPEWADNPARRSETWPVWQIVDYVFPGTGLTAGNTIEATWSDGYKYPPEDVRQHIDNQPYPEQGVLYVGENGSLLLPHQGLPQLFPREKFKAYPPPKVEPGHHYHDWASACLAGGPTLSSFDHAGPLAEVVLLGTVALRCPGEELLWDATNMKVTNLPEANQYVRRSYRKGCETSGPG